METKCLKCGTAAPGGARFCPNCGRRLSAQKTPQIKLGRAAAVVLIGAGIWGFTWAGQERLTGTPPKQPAHGQMSAAHSTPAGHSAVRPSQSDPVIKGLYDEVSKSPKDLGKRKALSEALLVKLNQTERPGPEHIMEVVTSLKEVLDLDPKDSQALINMAGVSFSSGVFDKAEHYYSRYLEVKPDDLQARSDYGATLLMLDQADGSIAQLNKVLAAEPENFHALVNLSVAFVKKGEKEEFRKTSEKALKLAPETDRAQLEGFLKEIEKDEEAKRTEQKSAAQAS